MRVFLQPLPLRGEQAPLVVDVQHDSPRPPTPRSLGKVRFASYVSLFENGRPPIKRSASETAILHVDAWRQAVAEAEQRAEAQAEAHIEASIWRHVRRAMWNKVRRACCCGPR